MNSSKKSSGLAWLVGALVVLLAGIAGSTYYTLKKIPALLGAEHDSLGSGNLAVLHIEGVIDDKKATEVTEYLDELSDEKDIKALVVRINSPGGTVGGSQEILEALRRYSRPEASTGEKKDTPHRPVVCSMADVTASGGVYLAMGCDKIFANAGTLTGSIGVIMQLMNLKDLYSWAKVEPVIIKAGKFKDAGSETRKLTDEERVLFQTMLDQTHRQFKRAILAGRPKLTAEHLDSFADGRVVTGEQAKELGLVDEIGTEYDAIRAASQMAGLKGKPKVVRERFKKNRLRNFFDNEGRAPIDSPKALIEAFFSTATQIAPLRLQSGVPYYLAEFALH